VLVFYFYFVILDVSAHCHRPLEFFPAAAFPKVATAQIIVRHQNICAFEPFSFQSLDTFGRETSSNPVFLMRWLDR